MPTDAAPLSTQQPFTLVLFGASGHLARLKLYPALYTLVLKKRLPEHYAIVGFARTDMDDAAFRKLVEDSVRADMPAVTEKALQEFLSHVHYHRGDYDDADAYVSLQKKLVSLEQGWKDAVRVAYLSVPPSAFTPIVRHLCASGVRSAKQQFRCIVEKPVGHDLQSAEALWKTLVDALSEQEIYFLDHWLGKEAVRNVYYLRLANPVLERILKNTIIEQVEITASETAGLEGRVGYFEGAGTLRDMVQSHLLEVATLMTMRLKENDDAFRESRLNALEQFFLPHASSLDDLLLQGQYAAGAIGTTAVPGYTEEEGVPKDSRTNTFIAMKLMTRISRFDGVPFFLRSGKRLKEKETRISIRFQQPMVPGTDSTNNRLDIILQGEAGMRLYLQTKLGGTLPKFRPLVLADPLVCVGDCLPEHGLLLLEAIRGKQQWFLTMEEVRAAWRIIDPLQAYLSKKEAPLHQYPAGVEIPEEAVEWIGKHGTQWMA